MCRVTHKGWDFRDDCTEFILSDHDHDIFQLLHFLSLTNHLTITSIKRLNSGQKT